MPDQPIHLRSTHQLVFIGGLHRSGTTPLARTLSAHPDVSGFENTGAEEDEGQHLQDLIPPAARFGGPGRFARNPASRLDESSALNTPDAADRLLAAWGPYWDLERRFLVEKSPPNLVRMRFLQALFPDASFVIIMRHPVIVSLSTKKWAPRTSYAALFENWFSGHDTMMQDAPSIRRLLVLRYEELVGRPSETLGRVADFLGLDGTIPTDRIQTGRSSSYERTWTGWSNSTNPLLRRRYRQLVEAFGGRALRYGYRLDDLDAIEAMTPPDQ